jgi:hypothetical protein
MPYKMLIGFKLRAHQPTRTLSTPEIVEQLEHIKKVQFNAQVSIKDVQNRLMTGPTKFKPYQIGEKVWLEGINLNLPYRSKKLSPKQYRLVMSQLSLAWLGLAWLGLASHGLSKNG